MPTNLTTASNIDDMLCSPLKMTRRRLDQGDILLRYLSPFSPLTMNFVLEIGSRLPKADNGALCRHHFKILLWVEKIVQQNLSVRISHRVHSFS